VSLGLHGLAPVLLWGNHVGRWGTVASGRSRAGSRKTASTKYFITNEHKSEYFLPNEPKQTFACLVVNLFRH